MLACALLVGSAPARAASQAKPLDDAELSGIWGQALLDLTNTTQGGFDFSRITLNADITMSSTLQRPGAGPKRTARPTSTSPR